MALSSISTWYETRDQMVDDALINLGVLAPGETVVGTPDKGYLHTHAIRALDRLIKSLDSEGMWPWRITELTINLVASASSNLVGTDYYDVSGPATVRIAGDTERHLLTEIPITEYRSLPDRTITGMPRFFAVDRTLSTLSEQQSLTVYFYPAADASYTVSMTTMARAGDMTLGSTTIDFPQHFSRALVYGLTAELAPAYQQPQRASLYWQLYEAEKEKQKMSTGDRGNLVLVPFGGY